MVSKINKNRWIGVKIREMKDYNYRAFWNNLTTIREDLGEVKELPSDYGEFYDVSLGTRCTTSCVRTKIFSNKDNEAFDDFIKDKRDNIIYIKRGNEYNRVDYIGDSACPFCYVSANPNGRYYEDICLTWKRWMDLYKETVSNEGVLLTEKPFQIALGSQGEPVEHPDFCDFLKTVYETNVVPNYTTNGVLLSYWNKEGTLYYSKANEILDATKKYVGGVAVSYGNRALRNYADEAIEGLIENGDCHVMIHHIISDNKSVDEFVDCWEKYGNKIRNHVLLPLMPSGRSKKGIEDGTFEYLENSIDRLSIKNVAFGAHFIKSLEKSKKIKTWLYPAESYSKNVLLKENKVVITPSSFDLKPIKIIHV